MRAVLSLIALLAPAQDDVDAAIRQFQEDWKKAELNEEKREALIAGLSKSQNVRFVPILCDAYDDEKIANGVRAKIAEVLGNYAKSPEAAAKLAEVIKANAKPDAMHERVLTSALAGMSKLSVAVSRKKEYVDAVAAYLSSKDNLVALTAARCLANIRSPDAIEPLLKEMLRNQNSMKELIGANHPNCDSG